MGFRGFLGCLGLSKEMRIEGLGCLEIFGSSSGIRFEDLGKRMMVQALVYLQQRGQDF